MELKIHKQNGEVRTVVSPADNSVQQLGVMEENVLSLSFVLYEFVLLEVNDYVDFEGFRYTLTEDYRPQKKSTIEYKYDVSFYGPEDVTKDTLVLKMVDNDNSAEFSLTDTALEHARLIVDNLNRREGRNVWVVGEVIETGILEVVYNKTSCFDGLTKIATAAETEWWIEGYSINISRCEHGTRVELGYNKGLVGLTKSDNKNARFFTRLYPLGSSRNIDKSKYGYTRLQLPGGKQYIEQNTHLGIKEQAEEAAFAHIYPRRIGYVDTVREEERTGEDGEKYTVYYFTDNELPFDPNTYEIGGLVKRIAFEDGSLNGRDFDVNFHSNTKEFEIITQFPFDNLQLPGGALIPKKGDPYVLYNITMPDEYYPLAEKEYEEAVKTCIEKYSVDVSIYKADSDYIHFLEKDINLKLGRRVRLYSDEYFTEGYRDSRIIRITRKVNNPYEVNIECSHAVAIGRLTQIENSLVNVEAAIRQPSGGGGLNLQVLRTWDSADPTDYNVFSALRTIQEIKGSLTYLAERFIRKDVPDTASGLITFNAGICTSGFVEGFTAVGKGMKVYEDGNVTLMELRARKSALFGASLSSETFVSGFPNGTGWMLADYKRMNAAGVEEKKYKLELDDLTVRGNFRVYEMIISQLRGENDNVIFAGQMKVDHIDKETNTIYLDTEEGVLYNPFRAGDILMVQRFGGLPTSENEYNVIKQYELKVSEAGIGNLTEKEKRLDYIRFDTFVGEINQVATGDVLTRVDSLTNSTRKGIMKITTIDEFGAPYLDVIYGMKTDLENSTKVRLGNLEGLVTPYWGRLEGWGLMATHTYLKGRFVLQTGEDVLTKFEITEGLIKSEIASIRQEIQDKDNYLSNAAFTKDTDKWEAVSDIRLFTISARFLYFNENFYSDKKSVAAIVTEGDRRALRLKSATIKQYNNDLAKRPEKPLDIESEEGEVWPTFYISFRYKCVKGGTLRIGFQGEECFFTEEIAPGDIFLSKEFSAPWNGNGDFIVGFSGDIYIYSLALADNPLENFKIETLTRFYQTDTTIGIMGEKIDEMAGTIVKMGLHIDLLEETLSLYAEKTNLIDNTVISLGLKLDLANQSISLNASKINTLDGRITSIGIDLNLLEKSLSLYVKDTDLTGREVISRINLTPGNATIEAKNINLIGAVTFNSFNTELQTQFRAKADSSSLGNLAYVDKVQKAMEDETLIVGGYIKTSLIRVSDIFANQITVGQFKINSGKLEWQDYGDGANLTMGYNSYYGNSCITVRAGYFGYGIVSIAYRGGAAIFGSSYSSPSYPSTTTLYAAFFDGDLVMTRGNIIVRSGGVSGKGCIQADEILPQNGFSGSMKGKSQEFKNGILIRAW